MIDQAIVTLNAHKDEWARLPIPRKIALLQEMMDKTVAIAEEWVRVSAEKKSIPADSPLVGEEWMGGPWAFIYNLKGLVRTLTALHEGRLPYAPPAVRVRKDGQVVVNVFPLTFYDRLLLNGYRSEVWMMPGITPENLADSVGVFYRQSNPQGKLAVLLAAGNLSSIAPMDLLYRLFVLGQVCIMKMNPVNDYTGKLFEEVFRSLEEAGYVRFVYGGVEVGEALVHHPGVDELHMTGSAGTHDAIVYGMDSQAAERKARDIRVNTKPLTCELGGACPTIVVPGPWDTAAVRFQAEHIVTQKYHNAGYNCVAAQVMVTPAQWTHTSELIAAVREVMGSVEYRQPYYPGSLDRQQAAVRYHDSRTELLDDPAKVPMPRTFITDIDPTDRDAYCFAQEVFGGVLAQISLPGSTPLEFLRNAVRFANDTLMGTLGVNIIIHPATLKAMGDEFENCLADLKYGAIGVNTWTASNYLFSQNCWGAFPGHTHQEVGSGIGSVHNTMMFDQPQKSVAYGPFFPFPRSWLKGEWHMSPKPGWFVTNRQEAALGRLFTYYEADPGLRHLPGLFWAALRG
jgi:aldehyde dehydrogenase (NAD(P)+)